MIHVDSDDWIEPDMLEKLYACAMDTKADIVCCNISLEYKSRQENLCYPYKEEQYKDLLYIDVLSLFKFGTNCIISQTCLSHS